METLEDFGGATLEFDAAQVPLYYASKTQAIIHKYGPGPRIHFHVGLFERGETPNTSVAQDVIRRRLVRSQEAMVERAAWLWDVADRTPETILDVGCGLGGGAILWAQRYGATVTALTVAGEHVPLIHRFADAAQVGHLVQPRLADVHELRDVRCYDAAVAFESSGYMDRARLFRVMAQALRPGGWFGVQEHFVRRPEWTGFIDGYYHTRLGTLTEYITAAREAGFELEQDEEVTDRVAEFWLQSMAWSTLELDRVRGSSGGPVAEERLTESALTHGTFYRLWRDRGIETRILQFRLRAA
ncbi:cyclopropane-fatty-acyl-phospholipid synthase family protein [Streptacidiphilus sp. MAP5-3]|uniref:SAM-dependent methyltransferase n=1 Tax=unclassified Streptacidiphilus TaxID=2643834 RepID=UPI003515DBAE